jgi:hypothetical protein
LTRSPTPNPSPKGRGDFFFFLWKNSNLIGHGPRSSREKPSLCCGWVRRQPPEKIEGSRAAEPVHCRGAETAGSIPHKKIKNVYPPLRGVGVGVPC